MTTQLDKHSIINKAFGRLTVIYYTPGIGYVCRCECGNIITTQYNNLVAGRTKSCGCLKQEKYADIIQEMVGKIFGRLTVVSYCKEKHGYVCKCECGNETVSRTHALKSGRVKSCGCYGKEVAGKHCILPENQGLINEVYKNYKQAAKKRDYVFELTKEQFKQIILSNCFYCGKEPEMTGLATKRKNDTGFVYNGVDRVDNTLGYVDDNCVPCCKICNNSKSTLTLDEWKDWIKRVYEALELK